MNVAMKFSIICTNYLYNNAYKAKKKGTIHTNYYMNGFNY